MYFIKTTDVLRTQNIEIRTFYVCTTSEYTGGINWNHRSLFILHHSQQTEVIGGSKERLIMCGEKNHRALKDDGCTGAFSEMGIDTTRGGPKIRQSPSSLSHPSFPSKRRFNVGGHPKHLFICTGFVCRTLPASFPASRSRRAGGET